MRSIYRPLARSGADGSDADLHLDVWPLNKSVIICADVNAHGLWDPNTEQDTLGDKLDDWLAANQMIIMNDGSPTRYRGKSKTTPDVTILHSSRIHLATWRIYDSMGSDNLPLVTHLEKVQTKEKTKSSNFNLKKADWTLFQCEMNEGLEKWEFSDSLIEHEYKRFSELILRAAKASVPTCSTNRTPKPWWNADCDQARSSYREKFNQWKLYPSDETATQRDPAKKKLDEVIRDGKSKAWKE